MSDLWHILDRGMIHFFSSFGVYLAAFFFLRFAYRKSQWFRKWIGPIHRFRLTVSVWALVWLGLWEGANVISGQSITKLWTDYLSWMVGLACAAWALHRYYWAVQEDIHGGS